MDSISQISSRNISNIGSTSTFNRAYSNPRISLNSLSKSILGSPINKNSIPNKTKTNNINSHFYNPAQNTRESNSSQMETIGLPLNSNFMKMFFGNPYQNSFNDIWGDFYTPKYSKPRPKIESPTENKNISPADIPKWDAYTGMKIANTAKQWNGKYFKKGVSHRCTDFVSTVIEQSGMKPPNFKHTVRNMELKEYGMPVDYKHLKPGDVVFFGNTWREGRYTHSGVYVGNDKFVHRPNYNTPVTVDRISSYKYRTKFSEARRL